MATYACFGKRYFQCVRCKRVFKSRRYWIETPEHCGQKMRFIKDNEARAILKGQKIRPTKTITAKVASREAREKRWSRRRVY